MVSTTSAVEHIVAVVTFMDILQVKDFIESAITD